MKPITSIRPDIEEHWAVDLAFGDPNNPWRKMRDRRKEKVTSVRPDIVEVTEVFDKFSVRVGFIIGLLTALAVFILLII